jgi:hypothetical protein
MASIFTNKGKYLLLGAYLRGETVPSNFYAPLFTDGTAPTVDTNVVGDLTQIATGNGYADGGPSVARSAVGFDVWTEDDTNDRALVQAADIVYTASGGTLPSSGSGARYMGVSDDNATVANRQLVGVFDLASDRQVSDGQSLTVQDAEFRLSTP